MITKGDYMTRRMETYYYEVVSHTGRMLTNQMIWWSVTSVVNRKGFLNYEA